MQSTLTVESIMLLPADLSADLVPHGKSGKRELVSVKFNSIQGYVRVIQLIDKSGILIRQSKINHSYCYFLNQLNIFKKFKLQKS